MQTHMHTFIFSTVSSLQKLRYMWHDSFAVSVCWWYLQ